MRSIIDEFRASVGKVAFLSGPPGEINIKDCFGKRSSVPADCIGRVTSQWKRMASVERKLAASVGGAWIDSRPWFCGSQQLCPSFVGVTPTKGDEFHLTAAYGQKIWPVINESFEIAGVF